MQCCEDILQNVPADAVLLTSDKAHFCLSGCVNKQNFRYWGVSWTLSVFTWWCKMAFTLTRSRPMWLFFVGLSEGWGLQASTNNHWRAESYHTTSSERHTTGSNSSTDGKFQKAAAAVCCEWRPPFGGCHFQNLMIGKLINLWMLNFRSFLKSFSRKSFFLNPSRNWFSAYTGGNLRS